MASTLRASIDRQTAASRFGNVEQDTLFNASSKVQSLRLNARSSHLEYGSARRGGASLPKPQLQIKSISTLGSPLHTFKVTYRSNTPLKRQTLNSQDILVSGPNGFSQLARFVKAAYNRSGTRAVAMYQIAAPGGAWEPSDNGRYRISLRGRQVSDVEQRVFQPNKLGSFNVQVSNPSPLASLSQGNFSGGSAYTFAVTYQDDIAIDTASIDSKDILVTGPRGYSQFASLVSTSPGGTGSQKAIYRVTAPIGAWDDDDNGTYTISLQPNEVRDRFGSAINPGTLGTFDVKANALPPTASLSAPSAFIGGSNYRFTVTYEDNGAVKFSTLDSKDIRVTGPNGFSQEAVYKGVDVNTGVATYEITPPGGVWQDSASGTYTISLQSNQVSDANGNFSPFQDLGIFQVAPYAIRVEAETLNLAGYFAEERNFLSGGKMIRVDRSDSNLGTASTLFNGPSGVYKVSVGYLDEKDGISQLSVRVKGALLDTWRLDDRKGTVGVDKVEDYIKNFRLRTVGANINLQPGDPIEIIGTVVDGEGSRVDYIEFQRVD